MLDKIKKLKVQAMKDRNKIEQDAYNAVISSVQTAKGRGVGVTDAMVLDVVKKEIKIFKETQSSDKSLLEQYQQKAEILENLLPKQLTEDELTSLFNDNKETVKNPKEFMNLLETLGHTGRYDKGLVARIVLKK